jgi:hypothetical protein
MQVRHDEVDIDAAQPRSVRGVRKESPDSMSWSNMVDYMVPSMFHKLAWARSCANTVHFLHSMNCFMDVKGASVMHYSSSMNLSSSPAELRTLSKQLQEVYVSGVKLFCRQTKQQRASHFLQMMLCGHQKNLVDFHLLSQKHPQ